MIEEFLCRVSFAGVPHTTEHDSNISQATVKNISPSDMCTLFWLLEGIRLKYSYAINGVSISRDFSTTVDVEPKYRLIAPVEFYTTSYDSSTMMSYLCRLDFSTVYFDENSQCGVKLLFNETDITGAINFNLQPMAGMQSVSLSVPFFNSTITVYLNYLASVVSSAHINYFQILLSFAE
ncbi:MAG: hypothetical protein LBF94_04050 [Puniceicoccales bacterium]|jgi:hypothetical protein|nr:hypothetical protein [Puniceicoccales bacterium]